MISRPIRQAVIQSLGRSLKGLGKLPPIAVENQTLVFGERTLAGMGAASPVASRPIIAASIDSGNEAGHWQISANGRLTPTQAGDDADLSAGTYTLGCTFHGSDGSQDTATITINVRTPEPMTVAHRTTGVAPLAVFFDPILEDGDAKGVYQPNDSDGLGYMRTHYEWDFGDTALTDDDVWQHSGRKKNQDTGFVAAHVYETPGTYTATLHVIDENGAAYRYEQTITVLDPAVEWRTYYVSTSGDDANSGLSEAAPLATIEAAVAAVEAAGVSARILLKRGDTWSQGTATLSTPNVVGTMLGAYGDMTLAKPVLHFTSGSGLVLAAEGCRVTDIQIVMDGMSKETNDVCIWLSRLATVCKDRLVMRVDTTGGAYGILTGTPAADETQAKSPPLEESEGIFVVDCDVSAYGYAGTMGSGYHMAWIGNYIHDTVVASDDGKIARHGQRTTHFHRFVSAHQYLIRCGSETCFKYHAPGWKHLSSVDEVPEEGSSKFLLVRCNRLEMIDTRIGGGASPMDAGSLGQVHHVLYEENSVEMYSGAYPEYEPAWGLAFHADYTVVRNNTVFADGIGDYFNPYLVGTSRDNYLANGYMPRRYRLYNNTAFRRGAPGRSAAFCGVYFAEDVAVCNGLLSTEQAPSAFLGVIEDREGLASYVEEYNVAQVGDPGFVDPANGGLRLLAGATLINAGMDLFPYVYRDHTGAVIPRNATPDIGAYEDEANVGTEPNYGPNLLATPIPTLDGSAGPAVSDQWIAAEASFDSGTHLMTAHTASAKYYEALTVPEGGTYEFTFSAKTGTLPTPKASVYDNSGTDLLPATSFADQINSEGYSTVRFEVEIPAGANVNVYLLRDSGTTGTLYVTPDSPALKRIL